MKKEFDCVEFKREIHRKNWERSGAKTLREYAKHVNEEAKKSPLWSNEIKAPSPEFIAKSKAALD